MKSLMRKANKSGAKFTMIIGEDELAKGVATVREMNSGEQKEVAFSDIVDFMDEQYGGV